MSWRYQAQFGIYFDLDRGNMRAWIRLLDRKVHQTLLNESGIPVADSMTFLPVERFRDLGWEVNPVRSDWKFSLDTYYTQDVSTIEGEKE
ncbi:hypothetical protein FGW37_05480 [Streptomyces rectiverticillatus]|uniref:hypothetical protein n=1 Tax=Streptomyces rectiverticillatus TaxID=173860 RepID=UPI0015C371BC|nr:hypothetical protein [Streptomyces rectiverticillatus]QLE71127.1 hypothetical protein FGW37_05480 [Streptomyces rectiverticillatus]